MSLRRSVNIVDWDKVKRNNKMKQFPSPDEITLKTLLTMSQVDLFFYLSDLPQAKTIGGTIIIDPESEKLFRPMLCSHLDTVSVRYPRAADIIKSNNTYSLHKRSQATCLGGDDRCGVYVMLKLLSSDVASNYIYAFFTDEEVGCVGSGEFSATDEFYDLELKTSCFVGLDRKCQPGVPEIASYGYDSEELDKFLDNRCKLFKRTSGTYTDCSTLSDFSAMQLPCINMSVGYNNEHTTRETIHLPTMFYTLEVLKSIEWPEEQFEYEAQSFGSSWNSTLLAVECDECGKHEKLWVTSDGYTMLCEKCMDKYGEAM